MKKLLLAFGIAILTFGAVFSQEEYTALKVTGSDIPVIDGTIDDIWGLVDIVPLTKVPYNSNITDRDPDSTDFYAAFGAVWGDSGLYVTMTIVDDVIAIVQDYYENNDVDADAWWYDDNYGLLFSQDLYNESFTQWEFAYQPMVNWEEKLSCNRWANAAKFDSTLVETAWSYDDDITYTMETFINWRCFTNIPSAGDEIEMEVRARDDDDDVGTSNWNKMFHWSTTHYEVESDGDSMGVVTLSADELTSVKQTINEGVTPQIVPNVVSANTTLQFTNDGTLSNALVSIYNVQGKLMTSESYTNLNTGVVEIPVNVSSLANGTYIIKLNSGNQNYNMKLIKL